MKMHLLFPFFILVAVATAQVHTTPEAILEAERLAADWNRKHECSVQDLRAELKPNDPAYVEAMELAAVLRNSGFLLKCVLQSKMIGFFEDEKGAALFRTDHGDFEGLFLPKAQSFAVQPIETRTDGRYIYSFAGSPHQIGGRLDSDKPAFFIQYKNQFLVTWEKQLAADLQKALRIPSTPADKP